MAVASDRKIVGEDEPAGGTAHVLDRERPVVADPHDDECVVAEVAVDRSNRVPRIHEPGIGTTDE